MVVPVHPLLRDRAVTLPPAARQRYDQATVAIARRQLGAAQTALTEVVALAPECVEAQRLLGLVAHMRGDHGQAIAILRRALEAEPDNALLHMNLGTSLYNGGEFAAAFASLRRACELAPDLAPAWFSLGRAFHRQGRSAGAITALHRAVDLAPEDAVMRSQLAEVQAGLGVLAEACANYRTVLQQQPDSADAWWGLAQWQLEPFGKDEVARLQQAVQRTGVTADDRMVLGFALARGLEDQGKYHDAFRVLRKANAQRRKQLSWNAAQASERMARIRAAFAEPPRGSEEATLGEQVVFLTGLPRSGVGLLRRVLAGHAQVDAADGSPHLQAVIDEESRRRHLDFPQWVADTTPAQWARMGNDYLARSLPGRVDGRCYLDASDQTGHLIGAAMAMLPGARWVTCERDALEHCFSWYRQLFASHHLFSYELDELSSFWRDHAMLSAHWTRLFPERVFRHSHDALLTEPQRQLRKLLGFLRLDDDPTAVAPETHAQDGTASEPTVVRVRLRPPVWRTPGYAGELNRLRVLLGVQTGGG